MPEPDASSATIWLVWAWSAVTTTRVRVLLVDGWHEVANEDGVGTFDLDAYEMKTTSGGYQSLAGGQVAGVPATGFTFRTPDGVWVYGPLTSVLAVETRSAT